MEIMLVRDAKAKAAKWVALEAVPLNGFGGAFFHGSVNWMADDDIFPVTSDIDIIVLLTDPEGHLPGKFIFDDLILEVSYLPVREFQLPEIILAKHYLAGSFSRATLIADNGNLLKNVQQAVAAKYPEEYWVRKRCSNARTIALGYLRQLQEDMLLHDQVTAWLFARGLLVHMMLVAGLKNPTVRKRYVVLKELLEKYGDSKSYETMLQLTRFAALDPAAVERHLHTLTAAFDMAAEIKAGSPYRFVADISPVGRSIVIDGSRELIRAGLHREAMFWIVASYCRCLHILFHNISPCITEPLYRRFSGMLEELGIATYEERLQSNEEVLTFLPAAEKLTEKIIQLTPGIIHP